MTHVRCIEIRHRETILKTDIGTMYHHIFGGERRMNLRSTVLWPDGPAWAILIRLAVGAVFLSEGIQKFLFPEDRAAGRFDTMGIPAPEFFGPLDGVAETVCGALLLMGLATRLAAVPMVINMGLALALTKVPILWDGSADKPDAQGFWDMAHEARTDWAMLLGAMFLLATGPGRWSLDALLSRKRGVPSRVDQPAAR